MTPKALSHFISLAFILFVFTFNFVEIKAQAVKSETILIGSIIDQNGDYVDNATVTISSGKSVIKVVERIKNGAFRIKDILPGKYVIIINSEGFDQLEQEIDIKNGINESSFVLQVKQLNEILTVTDEFEKMKVDRVLSTFLTKKEINSLPDSPQEIEAELKRRYGEDAVIRVDGFNGRIPPKSQISSIRVSQTAFDAENHEAGSTYIDISSKIGEQTFTGDFGIRFSHQIFNARNPFSDERLSDQKFDVDFLILGPLVQKKSLFNLGIYHLNKKTGSTLYKTVPTTISDRESVSENTSSGLLLDISQNLPKQHVARFGFRFEQTRSSNLGVGGYNIPERSYSIKSINPTLSFTESGFLSNRVLNSFRARISYDKEKTSPDSVLPGIIVINSFNGGGAGNDRKYNLMTTNFYDGLAFGFKKISFKTGAELQLDTLRGESRTNLNGTFTYLNLEDFTNGIPALYSRYENARNINVNTYQTAIYLQSDVPINKRIGLGAGIRYEKQNIIHDSNNFAPRIGVVLKVVDKGKLTLRGGAGVFYKWFDASEAGELQNLGSIGEILILNENNTRLGSLGKANNLTNRWNLASNVTNPYILNFSLGGNSIINNSLSVRFNYVYRRGIHMLRTRNLNAPLNGIRPFVNLGNVFQLESSANTVENALEFFTNGSVRKNISFGINYKISKSMSETDSIFSFPSNNYDLKADWSASDIDQRHRLNVNFNWLPRNNMQASLIYFLGSPRPFTITTGFDNNLDTIFNDRPVGIRRNSVRGNWENRVDLALSYVFSFLDVNKKSKGISVVSTSQYEGNTIFSNKADGKKFGVKIYARITNLLNTTNFSIYDGVQTSQFFLNPISSFTPRRMDFGCRFAF